jgi:hypothetical protein
MSSLLKALPYGSSAVIVVLPLYATFAFATGALPAGFPFLNASVFAYGTLLLWYNYLSCLFVDISRGFNVGKANIKGQFGVMNSDFLYAARWCKVCGDYKAPRTHHCSKCSNCVPLMDHHCDFIGRCVGFGTSGHFLLFLVHACWMLLVLLVYEFAQVSERLDGFGGDWWGKMLPNYSEAFNIKNELSTPSDSMVLPMSTLTAAVRVLVERAGPYCAFRLVVVFVLLVLLGNLGAQHCWLTGRNETVIARMYPQTGEYVEVFPEVYCPVGRQFYRRDRLRDGWHLVLGDRWLQRLWIPVPGEPSVELYEPCASAMEILRSERAKAMSCSAG